MGRGVFARLRRHDGRFSDDQIFTILRVGEDGGAGLAELREVNGVTFPMYCLWKAKYGQLTLPELRTLRRQEGRQALIARACLVTAIVLGAGGVGLFILPEATPGPASEGTARAVTSATDASSRPPSAVAPQSAVATPDPPLTHASILGPTAGPPAPSAHERYEVQVAAEPDLQGARTIVRRLETAGYAGYVLPATVGSVELYRVRIGPFESLGDAREIVRLLERDGYEGPWIAR